MFSRRQKKKVFVEFRQDISVFSSVFLHYIHFESESRTRNKNLFDLYVSYLVVETVSVIASAPLKTSIFRYVYITSAFSSVFK